MVTKLKMFCATSDDQLAKFKKLNDTLTACDVYVPIELNDTLTACDVYVPIELNDTLTACDVYVPIELKKYLDFENSSRRFPHLLFKLKDKGFPFILQDMDIFHYSIPSTGSHRAVHFIWKQNKNDRDGCPEQRKMISGKMPKCFIVDLTGEK